MLCDKLGENAGKVWMMLRTNGPMRQKELLLRTKLDENLFFAAVGWLARENKIHQSNDVFELKNTNLTEKIGGVAGQLWKILDMWEELDITTIKYLMKCDEQNVYAAAGWLARENKIKCKKPANNAPIRFTLK